MVSVEFGVRILGMVGFAVLGWFGGEMLAPYINTGATFTAVTVAAVGALTGLTITPYLTTRPLRWVRARVSELPISVLLMGMVGLIVGLIIAGLLSFPLSLLPEPFSGILPFVSAIGLSWLGVQVFVMRQKDIINLFRNRLPGRPVEAKEKDKEKEKERENGVLVDTSVIIDGRIADIARTGFILGTLLVPKFVLSELQHIADSSDSLRRNRGRRGLEVLNQLQKEGGVPVKFTDADPAGVREVDDKLVTLAKKLNCAVLTNDYNLNHVAQLQGVKVLNVNELANAVKVVFLPGETLRVTIIQDGKEPSQGVGYLDDGTMVVVDDGRRQMNQSINVVVTKIFQTTAGRMVFARLEPTSVGSGRDSR
ncbi:MAG: PIN domain nuclease [Anaerolineales bacterium]|nr:PIN domain nuclease [Anaerolineales bacterium]